MPDVIPGNLYDYPKYYDLVSGSDWKAEFDFLTAVFAKHGELPRGAEAKRLLEPACGTGRLMYRWWEPSDMAPSDMAPSDLAPSG